MQLIALMPHRSTKGNSVGPSYPQWINTYIWLTASGSLPPAPQMAVSSIAARPRSSLVRAGSLTETKLSANTLRCSGGPRARKDSYDSSEWSFRPVMRMSDLRFAVSSVDSAAGNGEMYCRCRHSLLLNFFCFSVKCPHPGTSRQLSSPPCFTFSYGVASAGGISASEARAYLQW